VFQQHRDLIVKDALLLVEGALRFDEFGDSWRIAARRVYELDRLREQRAQRIVLDWPDGLPSDAILNRLAEALAPCRPGACTVAVRYAGATATAHLELGPEWRVRASRGLVDELEELFGRDRVRIVYSAAPGGSQSAFG
jgi:DNA polymerase-3 subunit alpha